MRIVILLAAALAACSPYSPDLSTSPFYCGSGTPQCPEGFTCAGADGSGHMLCMSSAHAPDANDLLKMCADDSAVEGPNRNDTVATAYALPSPLPQNPFVLTALAICPMGDKDNYSLILSATHEIKVDMSYQTWGSALQGAILNGGGTPIKQMTPVSGMMNMMEADAANLPPGMYFIQVFGPTAPPGINNYTLSISVI
jgi:hypothetical protein